MAQSSAVTLASNSAVVGASSALYWTGGRAAVVITATTFPGTGCFLQVQNIDGNWAPVNTTTFSAAGVYPFDVPAGQVRLFTSGTAPSALYAVLVRIPYG